MGRIILNAAERLANQARKRERTRERYRLNSQRYRDKQARKALKQAALFELARIAALEPEPIPKTPLTASVYLPPQGSLALSLLQGRI